MFCRPDGRPLRPEHVLHRLHTLTADAGLPRIRVHDLRHLAATLMITAGVPLAVVSKTLRHSTLSVTVNIYGHLTRQAAHDAVEATASALAAATPAQPGAGRLAPAPAVRQQSGTARPPRDHARAATALCIAVPPDARASVSDQPATIAQRATTLRPRRPRTQTADMPPRAYPLVRTVGTAGFEPTTP
ncbi:tyrosine-type recombinase/integrase [Dactylosporangium sp. NPDC005572]|uniref:tyrosine-type recombinase/integrase n=1 Tax=Dactylosporangium sp. NPDC005572 TaxID=3156889 RepID=UPI0033AB0410